MEEKIDEKIQEDIKAEEAAEVADESVEETQSESVEKTEDRSAFNCPVCKGEGLKDQATICSNCGGTGKVG